jgi:hypothetical protein
MELYPFYDMKLEEWMKIEKQLSEDVKDDEGLKEEFRKQWREFLRTLRGQEDYMIKEFHIDNPFVFVFTKNEKKDNQQYIKRVRSKIEEDGAAAEARNAAKAAAFAAAFAGADAADTRAADAKAAGGKQKERKTKRKKNKKTKYTRRK